MQEMVENWTFRTYLINDYISFYAEHITQDKHGNPLKGHKTPGVKYKSCVINASVLVASATDL